MLVRLLQREHSVLMPATQNPMNSPVQPRLFLSELPVLYWLRTILIFDMAGEVSRFHRQNRRCGESLIIDEVQRLAEVLLKSELGEASSCFASPVKICSLRERIAAPGRARNLNHPIHFII